jgi:hypothetical protein
MEAVRTASMSGAAVFTGRGRSGRGARSICVVAVKRMACCALTGAVVAVLGRSWGGAVLIGAIWVERGSGSVSRVEVARGCFGSGVGTVATDAAKADRVTGGATASNRRAETNDSTEVAGGVWLVGSVGFGAAGIGAVASGRSDEGSASDRAAVPADGSGVRVLKLIGVEAAGAASAVLVRLNSGREESWLRNG